MQKEPDTQFRFTPQVALILVIVFFAMALPVVCVVLAAQNYFKKPEPALDAATLTPLQKALEDVADKSFEKKVALMDDQSVSLMVTDLPAAQKKLEERVAGLGGVTLPSDSSDGGSIHLLAQIPDGRVAFFVASPLQRGADEPKLAPPDDVEARTLVNVLIKKQAE